MIGSVNRKIATAIAGILAAVSFLVWVEAQEKANRPDHSGFKDAKVCQPCHADKYQMWEKSAHNRTMDRIANNPADQSDKGSSASSCLTCHNPGSDAHPKQLVENPEKLCNRCHSQRSVLSGKGAKGVEDIRSFHSGVSCVSCHMTEGNHAMKVLRPDDPGVSASRLDTCTRCHKDNNGKMRIKQLNEWHDTYKEYMEPIQAELAEIDAALKKNPALLDAKLQAKLDDARGNLSIIQLDKSEGAHNLDYSLEIMDLAKADLKDIKAAITKK